MDAMVVVIIMRLSNYNFGILIVCKLVWPDVLFFQCLVERLDVAVLLQGVDIETKQVLAVKIIDEHSHDPKHLNA
jgi:hypothetical protein